MLEGKKNVQSKYPQNNQKRPSLLHTNTQNKGVRNSRSSLSKNKIPNSGMLHRNTNVHKGTKRIGTKPIVNAYCQEVVETAPDCLQDRENNYVTRINEKQNEKQLYANNKVKVYNNGDVDLKKLKRIGRKVWVPAYQHQVLGDNNQFNSLVVQSKEMDFLSLPVNGLNKEKGLSDNTNSQRSSKKHQNSKNKGSQNSHSYQDLMSNSYQQFKQEYSQISSHTSKNKSDIPEEIIKEEVNQYYINQNSIKNIHDDLMKQKIQQDKPRKIRNSIKKQIPIEEKYQGNGDLKELLGMITRDCGKSSVHRKSKKSVQLSEQHSQIYSTKIQDNQSSQRSISELEIQKLQKQTVKKQQQIINKNPKQKRISRKHTKQQSKKLSNISHIKKLLPPAYPFNYENRLLTESITTSNSPDIKNIKNMNNITNNDINSYKGLKKRFNNNNIKQKIYGDQSILDLDQQNTMTQSKLIITSKISPIVNNQHKVIFNRPNNIKNSKSLHNSLNVNSQTKLKHKAQLDSSKIKKNLHSSSLHKTNDRKYEVNKYILDARKQLKASLHYN